MTCRVVPTLKCTERARLAVSKAVNLKTNFMVKLEAFRENVPADDFYSHPNDFHYKIAMMSYSHCTTASGIWLGICNCPFPGVSVSRELIKVILENEKVLIRENVPVMQKCKRSF